MRSMQLFLLLVLSWTLAEAQTIRLNKAQPDSSTYSNVYVKKISEDSLHSSYIIWVKKNVPEHYHHHHTELISIISGRGIMTINGSSFKVKKGDYFIIPANSVHAVTTHSRKPLKVLSTQCPIFDGDRIWIHKP